MISNIREYIRNIVGLILSLLLICIFVEFGLFRWLMSYVYNTPYWDRVIYSFHDIYVVISQIHNMANSVSATHEAIGYGLKIQSIFTLILLFGSFLIVIIVYSALTKILAIAPKIKETRFANYAELKKLGLFKPGGVVIAGFKTWTGYVKPIYHHGEEHIYLESTTGTGKTVASAIPSALSWNGSIIFNDNKGELYKKSAGYRQQTLKNNIIKLNLSCLMHDSAFFNGLLEIRKCSYSEAKDVSKIAKIISNITDKEFNSNDNPNIYFVRGPIYIIEACILHCLYTNENPTFKDVNDIIAGLEVEDLLQLLEQTSHYDEVRKHNLTPEQLSFVDELFQGETSHPTISKQIKGLTLVSKNPKQLAGLIDSARTSLQIFNDPLIQQITSKSTFRISQLVDDYQKTSLYLIYEPGDSGRLAVLIRMVFELAADYVMRDGVKPTFRNKLLLLIDEFPQLGKLEKVKQILEIGRSAGIKVFVIVQEKSQLVETYGQNQIITTQSSVKITYTPNSNSVEYIQKYMVGETEEHKKSVTKSSSSKSNESASINTAKEKKYIMTIDELLNLPIIQKKTITISFITSLNKIKSNNYKIDNETIKDLVYILNILITKFPSELRLQSIYEYFYRDLDVQYIEENDFNYLLSNEVFMEFISRPLEKELAIKPGDVIINISTLRPFRQYRGAQFCYMFDKEFLRRSNMKVLKDEKPNEIKPIDFKF